MLEDRCREPVVIARLGRDDPSAASCCCMACIPVDLETRVRQALDRARPLLNSTAATWNWSIRRGGMVRLRLTGSCHGCPSSTVTLRSSDRRRPLRTGPRRAGIEVDGSM